MTIASFRVHIRKMDNQYQRKMYIKAIEMADPFLMEIDHVCAYFGSENFRVAER